MPVCNRHVIFSFWASQHLGSLKSFFSKQSNQIYIKNKHKLNEGEKEANTVRALPLHLH